MATKEYEVGAAQVFFKGPSAASETNLGDTQGGIKVTVSTETSEIEVDQKIDPVDEIITKRTISVEVPLAEFSLNNLLLAFPGSSLVTDGTDATKKKLIFNSAAGSSQRSYAGELRIHPIGRESTDKSKDLLFPCAAPTGNAELSYDKTNLKVISVTFKAYPSEAAATEDQTMIVGDPAAMPAAMPSE